MPGLRAFNCVDLSPGDFAQAAITSKHWSRLRAEVVESAGDCAKRQNVRASEIDNMNVITNTRPSGVS